MSDRAVGIIANPVSGKDIRRLVANAPTSTLQEKYTIVRRAVIGAAAAGADTFHFLTEPHHICARAVETLNLGVRYHHISVGGRFDETDTVNTVAAMRDLGVAVVIVLGGDGTNRAAALGWRDVPVIPLSTGTNNVFPHFIEATVAGEAAGLVAAGHVTIDEVAATAKIVEVTLSDGSSDLALIDAVVVDERFVGSRALFDPAALRVAVLTRAEPASVGISSIPGLVAPCRADDDGGVVVRFAPAAEAPVRLRAPLAPGWYAEVGLGSVERLALGEAVTVAGPAILAFDGERQRLLGAGETATLRVLRCGPRVVDVEAALTLAAARGTFTATAPTNRT